MAGDGRRRHRAQYLTAQKRTMLSRSPIRRDRSCDTAWTCDPCIEADEAVQPLALKETADVTGKRKQVEDDAEISLRRPRTKAAAHVIKLNYRERLAADCDRSSRRRIWRGCQNERSRQRGIARDVTARDVDPAIRCRRPCDVAWTSDAAWTSSARSPRTSRRTPYPDQPRQSKTSTSMRAL
jgi:hypothetical protein